MITIRLRTIGIGLAAFLLGWGLTQRGTAESPASPDVPKVIQAHRFELLDAKGDVHAVLGLADDKFVFLRLGPKLGTQLRIGGSPGGMPIRWTAPDLDQPFERLVTLAVLDDRLVRGMSPERGWPIPQARSAPEPDEDDAYSPNPLPRLGR